MCDNPEKKELPYVETTHHGAEVSGPDKDGDIYLESTTEATHVFLSKEDLLMMLKRFDKTPPGPPSPPRTGYQKPSNKLGHP